MPTKRHSTKSTSTKPALSLRHRRRWHEGAGLSQRELARRVGLMPRQLYRLERRTDLPEALRQVLLVALALGSTVEDLVSAETLAALRAEVSRRSPGTSQP